MIFICMTQAEKKKVKAQIIKAVKARDTHTKEIDDFLLDNLIMNLILIGNAKKDIEATWSNGQPS